MTTTIYDITIPIAVGLAVWPGDTPYRFDLLSTMEEGGVVNIGSVTMSVHTGTHIDAPFHFDPLGAGADAVDIATLCGPAIVIDTTGHSIIGRDLFAGVDFAQTPRILIRTGGWLDHSEFPDNIPILAEDVPEYMGANGVILLGVDVPSVDAIDSKTLPNHHALAASRITALESVDLRAVPAGVYTLTALPLRLVGTDAAPVRAILTTLSQE